VALVVLPVLAAGCNFLVTVADDGSTNNLTITNTPGPVTAGVYAAPAPTTQPAGDVTARAEGGKP